MDSMVCDRPFPQLKEMKGEEVHGARLALVRQLLHHLIETGLRLDRPEAGPALVSEHKNPFPIVHPYGAHGDPVYENTRIVRQYFLLDGQSSHA